MYHVFGSKWLQNELSSLGYSCSSDEVTRYKQCVVSNENINDFLKVAPQGNFSQWSADKVDHRVCSIDGKGDLHGMGIVISTTGSSTTPFLENALPEIPRQKIQKVGDVTRRMVIPISSYVQADVVGLSKIELLPVPILHILSRDAITDLLWHAIYFNTRKNSHTRPEWNGYMSKVTAGDFPGKSTVNMLPIIDVNPGDMSCIFSTLTFIINQAKELNITTPVLTFDQPLPLKANEIKYAKIMSIVLILSDFYTMMSYCGSIGTLMEGSSLAEAHRTCYGDVSVKHIASGKAIWKALQAHFLTEAVIMTRDIQTYQEKTTDNFKRY